MGLVTIWFCCAELHSLVNTALNFNRSFLYLTVFHLKRSKAVETASNVMLRMLNRSTWRQIIFGQGQSTCQCRSQVDYRATRRYALPMAEGLELGDL